MRLIFTIDRNPDPEKFRLLDLGGRQLLCGDGGGDRLVCFPNFIFQAAFDFGSFYVSSVFHLFICQLHSFLSNVLISLHFNDYACLFLYINYSAYLLSYSTRTTLHSFRLIILRCKVKWKMYSFQYYYCNSIRPAFVAL